MHLRVHGWARARDCVSGCVFATLYVNVPTICMRYCRYHLHIMNLINGIHYIILMSPLAVFYSDIADLFHLLVL